MPFLVIVFMCYVITPLLLSRSSVFLNFRTGTRLCSGVLCLTLTTNCKHKNIILDEDAVNARQQIYYTLKEQKSKQRDTMTVEVLERMNSVPTLLSLVCHIHLLSLQYFQPFKFVWHVRYFTCANRGNIKCIFWTKK